MVRMPSDSRARTAAWPTPQMIETGRGAEEVGGLGAADDPEAAGLVEVGGDLGEELVVGEADRDGQAELALDAGLQAGEEDDGRGAVQALGAGKVEEGLVEGERLDEGGELEHHRAGSGG